MTEPVFVTLTVTTGELRVGDLMPSGTRITALGRATSAGRNLTLTRADGTTVVGGAGWDDLHIVTREAP